MKVEQILPTVLIVIDVGAACVYLYQGDLRKTIYWLAAATLTAAVTF